MSARPRASLKQVSTAALAQLHESVLAGRLRTPVDRAALIAAGVRHQLEAVEGALGGHRSPACLAILEVALAERENRRPSPELVWTGPEAPAGQARDTSVVLRELFESARESVIVAGYRFDWAREILRPLHATMRDYGVIARLFVDVPQLINGGPTRAAHLDAHLGAFRAQSWPFGAPYPHVHYDKRALVPGPPYSSMHAKCVVIDGAKAFVSSANFTERAQERNIEVGVLIDAPSFAAALARQWLSLIDSKLVEEYRLEGP